MNTKITAHTYDELGSYIPKRNSPQKSKSAFTLIELLVVVGLIAILAALLFPALRKARAMGKQAVCANNAKQLTMSALTYASDHNGKLLTPFGTESTTWAFEDTNWGYLLLSYIDHNYDVFVCPTAHPSTIGYNVSSNPAIQKYNNWLYNNYLGGEAYPAGTGYPEKYSKKVTKTAGIQHPEHCAVLIEKPFKDCACSFFSFSMSANLPICNPGDPNWLLYPHALYSGAYTSPFADGHVESIQRSEMMGGGYDPQPNYYLNPTYGIGQ